MKNAFTLVELSIVLVILGLLVGGVLAGQNLIRAAELRSVTTELTQIQTASMTFKEKYFAIPGDMDNATAFWGIAAGTTGNDTTCRVAVSTDKATCNGDGDGLVDIWAGSYEHYRFFQHLANAGLIEGSYTGTTGGTSQITSVAANSPQSKLSDGLWSVWSNGDVSGASTLMNGNYDNMLFLGGPRTNAQAVDPIMLPNELWAIDKKIDDSMPGTGKVKARCPNGFGGCITGGDPSDLSVEYSNDNETESTAPIFLDVF